MMIKAAFLVAFLALAASEQTVQQYHQYYNVPIPRHNYRYQQEGSQNGQEYNYYPQFQRTHDFNPRAFDQHEIIALVNNQDQPIGFIYWANSEVVRQQQQNFLPVRDVYGNLVGYYSLNEYKPGQDIKVEPLSEDTISHLEQFGFFYGGNDQDETVVIVVRNPEVLNYNENGVLRPKAVADNSYYSQSWGGRYPYNYNGQQYYNGQYPQQYGYRYGQQYYGPYSPRYQNQQYYGPYATGYQYQGQYNQEYQRQYNREYQGQYNPQYQGFEARFPHSYYQYASA